MSENMEGPKMNKKEEPEDWRGVVALAEKKNPKLRRASEKAQTTASAEPEKVVITEAMRNEAKALDEIERRKLKGDY